MYNQVNEVLNVGKSGLARVSPFAERKPMTHSVPVPSRDSASVLRRMLVDREGILDMLVKGRGSGQCL